MRYANNAKNLVKATPLPSPHQIHHHLPIPLEQQEWLVDTRNTISNILHGRDERLLLIMGPCSIHDIRSAEEFARNLRLLQERVEDTFFLIMRTYIEKARTIGGWKGFLYDPHLDGSNDIEEGIHLSRTLFLSLARQKIPTGAELLHPIMAPYYADLLSWGSIGARTCTSQIHRELASLLRIPIGIKNTTEGNVQAAIHGMVAAQKPQKIVTMDELGRPVLVKTEGNIDLHLVLRGGERGPNYHENALFQAGRALESAGIHQGILVDCSHGNSGKVPEKQKQAFETVFANVLEGMGLVRGFMLESNIVEGKQPLRHPHSLDYGRSITDGCLSWEQTEELVSKAYEQKKHIRTSYPSLAQKCPL